MKQKKNSCGIKKELHRDKAVKTEEPRLHVNVPSDKFLDPIDLFGSYILFSQYRSCDNTQEAWSFVLFIKKSACWHIHACMPSF